MSVNVPFIVVVTALLSYPKICGAADEEFCDSADVQHEPSHVSKRQIEDELCNIPEALSHGLLVAHPRRCPAGDNSAPCRLEPHTPVSVGWVLQYRCNLGYQLANTSRLASICLRRPGGARWLPPLPVCVESKYKSNLLPDRQTCGKPARHLRARRKVDGKQSVRGAWPWMVMFGHLKSTDPNNGYHWFCAGTLVTPRHIITTANCLSSHRKRPSVFVARLDDLNLDDSDPHHKQVSVEWKSVIIHPVFDKERAFNHNIAIVRLKNSLEITDYVRPICLPTPDFKERNFTNQTVQFISWGQNDKDFRPKAKRTFEPILHEVSGRVFDHEKCNVNYRDYQALPVVISGNILCASLQQDHWCQYDVGSPLVMEHEDRYYLLGIVATPARFCNDERHPRLFTYLPYYMDWVVANLRF